MIRVPRGFRELRGYDRIGRMGDAALCVMCRTRPVDPQWRPFCSERCRNEDLARWADGRYRVEGEQAPSPDDLDQDHNNGE